MLLLWPCSPALLLFCSSALLLQDFGWFNILQVFKILDEMCASAPRLRCMGWAPQRLPDTCGLLPPLLPRADLEDRPCKVLADVIPQKWVFQLNVSPPKCISTNVFAQKCISTKVHFHKFICTDKLYLHRQHLFALQFICTDKMYFHMSGWLLVRIP